MVEVEVATQAVVVVWMVLSAVMMLCYDYQVVVKRQTTSLAVTEVLVLVLPLVVLVPVLLGALVVVLCVVVEMEVEQVSHLIERELHLAVR